MHTVKMNIAFWSTAVWGHREPKRLYARQHFITHLFSLNWFDSMYSNPRDSRVAGRSSSRGTIKKNRLRYHISLACNI